MAKEQETNVLDAIFPEGTITTFTRKCSFDQKEKDAGHAVTFNVKCDWSGLTVRDALRYGDSPNWIGEQDSIRKSAETKEEFQKLNKDRLINMSEKGKRIAKAKTAEGLMSNMDKLSPDEQRKAIDSMLAKYGSKV